MLWLRRSPGMRWQAWLLGLRNIVVETLTWERWQAWLLGLRNIVVETLTWDALAGLVVRFEKCCG